MAKDPTSAHVKNSFAWTCFRADQDLEEGISFARAACELEPSATNLHTLACLEWRLGHTDQGFSTFRTFLSKLDASFLQDCPNDLTRLLREILAHLFPGEVADIIQSSSAATLTHPWLGALRHLASPDADTEPDDPDVAQCWRELRTA